MGSVFLSSSHGRPASLFPSSLGTRFKRPEDVDTALHICQLLHHGRSMWLRTEPPHLCMEQKRDLCAPHPQLFSTNTKSPASPTGSLKVRHAFPVAHLSCRLKSAKKVKKKKKKKRIRFSEELLGKTKLVFFQRQVLGGVCWVSILPYLLKESELFPKYIIILTGQMEVSGYKAKILHFSKSRHFSYQRLTKLC